MNAPTRLIAGAAHPHAIIHPQAHVQNGCTIGARTRVWQFASIIRQAIIGEDCSIAAGAIVDGSEIGNGTIVSHCAFIDPGMMIGSHVFIGPFVALCNDCWPRAHKEGFDMEALISGDLITTRIENGASIGAHATILPGLTIGCEAMVAAGAVVTTSVPDRHIYYRDGMMVPIDPKRNPIRMRVAS
jgi:UDP-2-acetamido-3-amino-2,3-dideoxy-glucuronate N-acetyltransferase